MSPPTQGPCEGFLGMRVDEGSFFDGVSLDGAKWCVAYHWPGPLHEGNGTVKPYFDPSVTEEQMNALGQILTGQAGVRGRGLDRDRRQGACRRADRFPARGQARDDHRRGSDGEPLAPIENRVTGDEETVRVCIPGGLEYSRGDGVAEILTSQTLRSTDEIAFEHRGVHTSLVEHQEWGNDR